LALKVKPIDASTTKWEERARGATSEYGTNAAAAASDWAKETEKAASNYGMAIAAAGIKERFRRGVARAGAAKYQRKIESVGADRYAPGISAATMDYKAGFEPYHTALTSLTLSARKPRGDPSNLNRVAEVAKALNAKRLALLGATGG